MNLFMHEFDTRMLSFIKKERIGYVRYADDMIIAIKRGRNSDKVYLIFKQFFHRSLNDLKLSQTSEELIREKRKKILILGLVVSIGVNGSLVIKAPLKRWIKKLTFNSLMAKMGDKKGLPTSPSFFNKNTIGLRFLLLFPFQ